MLSSVNVAHSTAYFKCKCGPSNGLFQPHQWFPILYNALPPGPKPAAAAYCDAHTKYSCYVGSGYGGGFLHPQQLPAAMPTPSTLRPNYSRSLSPVYRSLFTAPTPSTLRPFHLQLLPLPPPLPLPLPPTFTLPPAPTHVPAPAPAPAPAPYLKPT